MAPTMQTTEEDYDLMREMALVRSKIMQPDLPKCHLLIFGFMYRFLELKMFIYQWSHKSITVSFSTPEQQRNIRVAARVISQFKDTLTTRLNYHAERKPEAHIDTSVTNSKKQQIWDPEMSQLAVQLIMDVMIVIDIFDKNIRQHDVEILDENNSLSPYASTDHDLNLFTLEEFQNWYQKLSYFFMALSKILKIKMTTAIICYSFGPQILSNFETIAMLPSVVFVKSMEQINKGAVICKLDNIEASKKPPPHPLMIVYSDPDPPLPPPAITDPDIFETATTPQHIHELLTSLTKHLTVPNAFNAGKVTKFLQDRWDDMYFNDDVVFHKNDQ